MKLLKKNWTHWQWYKSFFSITILRYFVIWFSIVPMLALWLKQIPKGEITINNVKYIEDGTKLNNTDLPGIINSSFTIDLSLPFTWELLWASSLFFVAALIVYMVFCPSFIKKYPSFKEYKSHYHSPRWAVWEALNIINDKFERESFFERLKVKDFLEEEPDIELLNKNEVRVEKLQSKLYFNHEEKIYSLGMPIIQGGETDQKETDRAEREIFWEIFGRFSTSKTFWRGTIISFLFLSLILFSIPVIQNITKGSIYLYEVFYNYL